MHGAWETQGELSDNGVGANEKSMSEIHCVGSLGTRFVSRNQGKFNVSPMRERGEG